MEFVALAAAFVIAVLATPAGISGAVLLLPFQVSVLGTPSPAVTPTNLLYNVVATPGALYRYWRQGQTGGRLALVLIAGIWRTCSSSARTACSTASPHSSTAVPDQAPTDGFDCRPLLASSLAERAPGRTLV
jgi:uncharacterized membrane protein YfcA